MVAVPGAERGLMFGCPVYSLNGERYAVLHEGRIALRLNAEDGVELIEKGGWPWEPMKGRRSKGRVVVQDEIAGNARSLRAWVKKAVRHAR